MAAFPDDFDEVDKDADYFPKVQPELPKVQPELPKVWPAVERGWIGKAPELGLDVIQYRINTVMVETGLGELKFPELWIDEDYIILYDFLKDNYVYNPKQRKLPKDPTFKEKVLFKITAINLNRRTKLYKVYNVVDTKREYDLLQPSPLKTSAFLEFSQFYELYNRLHKLHLADLKSRREGLTGGRTNNRKRRRTKRVKKRKTYRQFRR